MAGQAKSDKALRGVAERVLSLQLPRESSNEFAKRIGVKAQSVSNWRSGREAPSLPVIVRLVEETDTSALWLLTGALPKKATPPAEADLRLALTKAALSASPEEIRKMLAPTPSAGGKAGSPKVPRKRRPPSPDTDEQAV